jgi:hypothetical protein
MMLYRHTYLQNTRIHSLHIFILQILSWLQFITTKIHYYKHLCLEIEKHSDSTSVLYESWGSDCFSKTARWVSGARKLGVAFLFCPEATFSDHVVGLIECGAVLKFPFIKSNKLHNRNKPSLFTGWLDNWSIEKEPSLGTNSCRVTDGWTLVWILQTF